MENKQYIGISEDGLHHILGVARKAYDIAKEEGYNEDFCRKMFMIGWVHDVGFEFSETYKEHPRVSSEMLYQLICMRNKFDMDVPIRTNHAIWYHGQFPEIGDDTTQAARVSLVTNDEWRILNMADMQVDSKGNEVSVTEKLSEIKDKYGEGSEQYKTACEICVAIQKLNKIYKKSDFFGQ